MVPVVARIQRTFRKRARTVGLAVAGAQAARASPHEDAPHVRSCFNCRRAVGIVAGPRSAMCGRLRVGKSFLHVLQHWSVQPCVRPINAVHMTAGHNALRGSGPDQQLAFKNAMARVGCPDRRIDRLCITCCSPSQPSHHASCPTRFRLSRKREGFLVSLAPWHHGPDHRAILLASAIAATLVGRRASKAVSQGRCLVPWILA